MRIQKLQAFVALIVLSLILHNRITNSNQAWASTPVGTPTPAVNRLAEPTLPSNPNQADQGAQTYWLYCMACHGDRGQGLTAEFRTLYPREERNCWNSGCHGVKPYTNGWTLPSNVPKLIGPGSLEHFETAASLFAFIQKNMPFQSPGSLNEETYWQITSFLLRHNGFRIGPEPLGLENADTIRLQPLSGMADLEELHELQVENIATSVTPAHLNSSIEDQSQAPNLTISLLILSIVTAFLIGGAIWLIFRARIRIDDTKNLSGK